MKSIFASLFYFFIFCQFTFSQTNTINFTPLKTGVAEAAHMSSERVQRIDNILQQYVDSGRMNGAVALVIRNGKVAYYQAFGYNDVVKKIPLKKDGIFRMASQTKAITSVAVMMLYEEGKFLLDEPVSKYIPSFHKPLVLDKFNPADTSYTTIPAKREITIRDLLTHTSGIGYAQIGSKEFNAIYAKAGVISGIGVDKYVLGDVIKTLGTLPLVHQPGERWTYGLNVDVLGYLVEVVSGLSLAEFFKRRIFDPLGMKDTYFYLPKDKQDRLVELYTEDSVTGKAVRMPAKTGINGEFISDYPNTKGTYYSGGGGLSGTIYDYAIFLQMMLNGGEYNGKRILSRNAVRMMTMNQIGDLNQGNKKFGLGFSVTTEKASGVLPTPEGVYEWGGMFATTYWVDPKEKMVALLYRNIYPTHYGNLSDLFKVLVYQAIND
jgi:CubicO group peptidase (beta-lactamase class C family)